tara:strand:+ start:16324 stop:17649 length:1326 start_codon:yes stop_codon:yes gene_type:complete
MATIVIPPGTAGGSISQIDTGNTLWVDAVFGNDGTALPDRQDKPYLTIAAAIAAASSGDIVMLRPGDYAETIVMATGVSVKGVSREVCTIIPAMSNDTVVEMAANCSLEEVTITANTDGGQARIAIFFAGTSSATSYARNVRITGGGLGNVTGVGIAGSGASPANWVTLDHVDIIPFLGAYGLSSTTTGNFLARDCIFDGVLGVNVGSTGTATLQDCRISGGFASLVIDPTATCKVNQGTRWAGNVNFAGTLIKDGEFLQEGFPSDIKMVTGRWYDNSQSIAVDATSVDPRVSGDIYAVPFKVSYVTEFDRIAVESTQPITGVVRLGIFNHSDATGGPGTRILDAGTVTNPAAGAIEITIAQKLQPGNYWLAAVHDHGANRTFRCFNNGEALGILGYATSTTTDKTFQYIATGVGSGAFPASFPAGAFDTDEPLRILLRVA